MSRWTWVLMLGLCLWGGAVVRAELVGRWSFDDFSLKEESGFAPAGVHDASSGGTVRFSEDVPPEFTGVSLEFVPRPPPYILEVAGSRQGTDGYQPTFDTLLQRSGAMSISFWMKAPLPPPAIGEARAQGEYQALISKWTAWSGGARGIIISRRGGGKLLQVSLGFGAKSVVLEGRTPVFDDQWHHIVVTRDGRTARLYVDGREDASADDDMTRWDPEVGSVLRLGAQYETFRPYVGKLDEVRVYNEALAGDQILELLKPGK